MKVLFIMIDSISKRYKRFISRDKLNCINKNINKNINKGNKVQVR